MINETQKSMNRTIKEEANPKLLAFRDQKERDTYAKHLTFS